MEICGKTATFVSRFSGPDWGNTAWADMAELGSIGLHLAEEHALYIKMLYVLIVNLNGNGPLFTTFISSIFSLLSLFMYKSFWLVELIYNLK